MTRALLSVLCALSALSACNVASVQEQKSTIAQNQCTGDSDCPGGSCAGNECRTTNGTFETMLFEVTPPADTTSIAGVQFLKTVTGVAKTGGALDLNLDLVAQVTGEVTLSTRDCSPKFDDQGMLLATASDASVPALITLVPSLGSLGLFASPTAAQSTLANEKSYAFSINVPPGQYDIYVQPRHQPDDSCVVPPQLLLGQTIKGGTLNLAITLPEPSTFDLHVSWPLADGALDGWSVDMLDPVSGRVISNSVALALESGGLSYLASLSYLPVVGDMSKVKAQELVRLSPPDGVTAPSVLLSRGALSLFSANSGTLSQFTALPVPVHVEGQVTALSRPTPAAATVTLVATKIAGVDPGVLASFVRTANAGDDGTFDIDLLPGTYRVSAVPGGTSELGNSDVGSAGLAEASTDWAIADSPSTQAGKLIELNPTLAINGAAFDAGRTTSLSGAQVLAIVSPASIVTDVLHVALGETVYVPRASNASVRSDGSFALSADSGTFDFSVRPQASTGFSWLVIPSLGVGTTPATSNGPALGDLLSPLPVSYTGTVTVPGVMPGSLSPVPGALIRTYLYMSGGAYTADSTQADSVLQIAETRSDEFGAFELLIPAALNKLPM
jgi:hypothetical protein